MLGQENPGNGNMNFPNHCRLSLQQWMVAQQTSTYCDHGPSKGQLGVGPFLLPASCKHFSQNKMQLHTSLLLLGNLQPEAECCRQHPDSLLPYHHSCDWSRRPGPSVSPTSECVFSTGPAFASKFACCLPCCQLVHCHMRANLQV